MATLFTKIIGGELPGVFVWRDEKCVAFLSINPAQPGHTLVVPREEIDHWIDLNPDLLNHLSAVVQTIAQAQQSVYSPAKIGLLVAGLEVPHVHLHVIPIVNGEADLHLDQPNPTTAEALEAEADKIRGALRAAGATGVDD